MHNPQSVIRHLIWDVDGTLFNTYPAMAAAMRAALADLGVDESSDRLGALARVSVDHCVSTMSGEHRLDPATIVAGFLRSYARIAPEDQPPFAGVREVCAAICAAGGKNAIVTHRRRESTAGLLAAHDMGRYFVGAVTHDDGYPRKPDPAAFVAAIEAHGLPREETMTIGDRDIDILAGQAAGVATCLFGTPGDAVTPDLIIGSFDELLVFLRA
jgi:phosphoglycolate phosphatase-like HAD superfamily hydrolase